MAHKLPLKSPAESRTPPPTNSVTPSNAAVDNEPQPACGSTQPTAICVFHTRLRSDCWSAYKKPSFPVAATRGTPPRGVNNVGEEPQSRSASTSSAGSKNDALTVRVVASSASNASDQLPVATS